MTTTARLLVTAIGVTLIAAACGSDTREGVELPGLDGAPSEFDVNLPPELPTTTVATATSGAAVDDLDGDGDGGQGDGAGEATSEPETSTTVVGSDEGTATVTTVATVTTEAPAPDTTDSEPPAEDVFLRVGDEGPEVASVQRRLIALEYLPAGADSGVFDQATADALIDFQAQYGLIVDGIFGPESDRALNAASASVAEDG